jgi:hypothetical protein
VRTGEIILKDSLFFADFNNHGTTPDVGADGGV